MLLALSLAAAAPVFDPFVFFAGATEGVGRLKVVLRRGRRIQVTGSGRMEDGVLVLDQVIAEEGKPVRTRQWRIRRDGPGRYAGTLTDARGPIAGQTRGDRLILRYRTGGGIAIEQRLVLAADGRSAGNRLTARKFGVRVAVLTETIRRRE